jgi:hypothetical protein
MKLQTIDERERRIELKFELLLTTTIKEQLHRRCINRLSTITNPT